jgi:hypothetical protein
VLGAGFGRDDEISEQADAKTISKGKHAKMEIRDVFIILFSSVQSNIQRDTYGTDSNCLYVATIHIAVAKQRSF